MKPAIFLCATAFLLASPVLADEYGTLNPDEMGMERMMDNIRRGQTDMTTCASGYLMTKGGRHGIARETFTACADAGFTGAMTWMGYMEQNGFGSNDFDPEAAAEWDRLAAERGDPVGQFNHGLNMIRGFGTAQDEDEGRRLIDAAAKAGLEIAQRMQAAGYDPDEVTPDADNWRYAPLF